MARVSELLESVTADELYKLKADLNNGGRALRQLVDKKIRSLEEKKGSYCVTCGKDLEGHPTSFNLVFGQEAFKKKASFCELDCLEYFIAELKSMREQNMKRGEE